MARDFGPRADADPVGLLQPSVGRKRLQGRLAVVPDALLEGPTQLRLVRFAYQVVALVVEGRVQEEALVLQPKVPVGLADAALAQGDELLAFGESADGDRPFLQSDWHSDIEGGTRPEALDGVRPVARRDERPVPLKIRNPSENPKSPANRGLF